MQAEDSGIKLSFDYSGMLQPLIVNDVFGGPLNGRDESRNATSSSIPNHREVD